MTLLAYLLLALAIIFALAAVFLPWFVPEDGELDIDEPSTLDVQNHQGDTRPIR